MRMASSRRLNGSGRRKGRQTNKRKITSVLLLGVVILWRIFFCVYGEEGSLKENGILSQNRFGLIHKRTDRRRFFCSTCVICFILVYLGLPSQRFYQFSITINLIISLIGFMQSLWNTNMWVALSSPRWSYLSNRNSSRAQFWRIDFNSVLNILKSWQFGWLFLRLMLH